MPLAATLSEFVAEQLVARNASSRRLFSREAERLAHICEEMAQRFLQGGRLIAFGRGAAATDAQHVAVEFVHPVLVGKRALPALDLSTAFEQAVPAIVGAGDIAIGFGLFDERRGDYAIRAALHAAHGKGALTLALPGDGADPADFSDFSDFSIRAPDPDPFISQELIEVLYHTLWETVHIFFEHRERGHDDVGASAFLYPFLGGAKQDMSAVADEVAASIRTKASDDEALRERMARDQAVPIAAAIADVGRALERGATLLLFGNGGSATDANDWAIDCVSAPDGTRAIPALSLSADPASLTAIANDIGREAIFLRQLIAHGRQGDVAIAISTSGGSANIIAALEEAKKRGMLTVALLGYDGGEIARRHLADLPIVVPSDYIPRIQEVQASVYHVMTGAWQRWNV